MYRHRSLFSVKGTKYCGENEEDRGAAVMGENKCFMHHVTYMWLDFSVT